MTLIATAIALRVVASASFPSSLAHSLSGPRSSVAIWPEETDHLSHTYCTR